MRRPIVIIAGLIVIVVGAYVVWWLASPLFIDQTVDEAFPTTLEELNDMSMEEIEAIPEAQKEALQVQMEATAAAMPDEMVEEAMPEMEAASGPVQVVSGSFVDADSFHQGSGTATIYQLEDGQHVLRFEDFNVTNGPDLHVLLSPSADPAAGLGDYIDLGQLKGNMGNQNYTIPADVDVSQYQHVIIYCLPFHVLFSTAALG